MRYLAEDGSSQRYLTVYEDGKLRYTTSYCSDYAIIYDESAKTAFTDTGLNKSKKYKYYVRAYKLVKGEKVYLAQSPAIHVALSSQKYTNAKKVTTTKSAYMLQTGKTAAIKAEITGRDAKKALLTHAAALRYYSEDKTIATVSKDGKITAKKAGKTTIYVLANNGVYKKITVTVK